MEPASLIGLKMTLTVVLLPMGTVAGLMFLGQRLGKPLGGIAVLAGLVVAHLGVGGLPSGDAYRFALYGLLFAGLGGLALDRFAPRRAPLVALLALLTLSLFAWLLLRPLAGLWKPGQILGQVASTEWVVQPLLWGLVGWLCVDRAAEERPNPVLLGPLTFAFIGAAGAVALSGSALAGTLLGASAAALGGAALLSWRWPEQAPGHAGLAAGFAALTLYLLYGRFYVEAPTPALTLALAIPLVTLLAYAGSTLQRVLLGVAFALPAAGLSVGLAFEADRAKSVVETPAPSAPGGAEEDPNYGYPDAAPLPY